MGKLIGTIDAETDPFLLGRVPEPFIWGVYLGDLNEGAVYHEFRGEDCTLKLVEFLYSLDGWILYAHNGGKFDFFFLFEWAAKNIKVINGRIAKMEIGACSLRDSYLILPLPQAQLTKMEDFDYKKMERGVRHKHMKEISDYLYSDVFNLYTWVRKFIDRFGMKLTLPSAAFEQLKKTGYEMPKSGEWYDAQFRPFYYGGRTQAFKKGTFHGKFVYIDINSAYPLGMKSEHPSGTDYIVLDRLPEKDECEGGGYFARIDAIAGGCLPLRGENGLEFPDDNMVREYSVTGWEIQAGLDTGTLYIVKIHEVYVHDEYQNFNDYVDKFYAEKKEGKISGDKATELFSKLMLNSAYGKFGQDGRKFKEFEICEDDDDCPFDPELCEKELENLTIKYGESKNAAMRIHLAEKIEKLRADLENFGSWSIHSIVDTGQVIWEKPSPSYRFYNVATAASITGFVRAYMFRNLKACKNPYYCDTDSIICDEQNVSIGLELGQWGIEGYLSSLYIGGKKMYAGLTTDGEWKVASKGARLTHEHIIDIVQKRKTIYWENEAPSFSLKNGARFVKRNIKIT